MKEIEFLTEKDLPYFRKKEKTGEAIIIEISEEDLLQMDTKDLLRRESAGEIINRDELQKWIDGNMPFFHQEYEKAHKRIDIPAEKGQGKSLAERLIEVELSPDKRSVIEMAILNHMPEASLLYLLSDYYLDAAVSADEMQEMCNALIAIKSEKIE